MKIADIAAFALDRSFMDNAAYDRAMSELDPREV